MLPLGRWHKEELCMKRWLAVIFLVMAPVAAAGQVLGNVGTVRGDYWTRFNELELNVVLSAIPIVDVELGIKLPSSDAHLAVGPRFEVLSRESEAGPQVRLVVLFGAWFSLGGQVQLTDLSVSPGVEATYWFARRFGITGSVSVPFLVPYQGGALNGAGTQGSPRLGVGLSF